MLEFKHVFSKTHLAKIWTLLDDNLKFVSSLIINLERDTISNWLHHGSSHW